VAGSEITGRGSRLRLLLVSPDRDRLTPLAEALAADPEVEVAWASSGQEALAAAAAAAPVLAVIDQETGDLNGLELARRLLFLNPMINTALLSGLDEEAFAEAAEGLGVLAGLSLNPGPEAAGELLARLRGLISPGPT